MFLVPLRAPKMDRKIMSGNERADAVQTGLSGCRTLGLLIAIRSHPKPQILKLSTVGQIEHKQPEDASEKDH